MPPAIIQVPSIILPQAWEIGTETEAIDDLVTHPSIDIPIEYLQEKIVHVFATEVARAIGTIVGVFTTNEPIVGIPSGATGILRAQGAGWIEIINIAGAFAAGDTITGTLSGATINGGLAFAVPGNLQCWIELSPVPSTISTSYWAAIGGGGGPSLAPVAPTIEASALAGAPGILVHTMILPWAVHSPWARLVVQTPVSAALPNAYWHVQALISAGTK